MTASMVLLRKQGDWEDYKRMCASEAGIADTANVNWGNGPLRYPCLVASYFSKGGLMGAGKLVSCYVYTEDARRLLAESQSTALPEQHSQVVAVNTVGPAQVEFNQHILAHVCTLMDILIKTHIVKEDQYEQWYTSVLAKVDQEAAATHHKTINEILGRTTPQEEDD